MAKTKIGANAIFSGPQKGLTFIGDYCYAYSGAINGTNSFTSYLSFQTNKALIVAKIQYNGAPDPSDPSTGGESICRISFNGQVVAYMKASTNSPDANGSPQENTMVIPPLTQVDVDVVTGANSSFQGNVVLSGRVYDA